MKFALLLLIGAPIASAASLGLLAADSAAMNPASLAQSYADELPKLGPLMPKELLRDHIRRDLMPRLMSTQDDRTTYELGLNIFEKLGSRSGSLVELNQQLSQGQKINKHEAKEILDQQQELSSDIELLGQKIQDNQNNGVSSQTLKLLANSAQGYACAYKATEISVISKGKETKQDCTMPFPGAFIMLNQKISVPEKVSLAMPDAGDANYLQPQEWMTQHMRRKVWCPDSFDEHGFDEDIMCDAITAALNMPRHDELQEERSSLLQIEEAKAQGKPAPAAVAPPVLVPAVGAAVMMEEQAKAEVVNAASSESSFTQKMEEYKKRSQELEEQAAKSRNKLSLLQKRSKLRQLKEKLAAHKAELSLM